MDKYLGPPLCDGNSEHVTAYKTPIRILLGYGSAHLRGMTAQELLHLVIKAGPAAFLAA